MKMMAVKAVSSLVFILVLLISFSLYFSTLDLRSHFSSSLPFSHSLCRSATAPLRVYMYDLPRRFNFEMIDHGRHGSPFMPPWSRNSGLKKQHSVEYWMMVSLLYKGDADQEMEAVRVLDPESADAFFVPFFSSLSFNTHGHNMTDPETEVDRQLQIELLGFLRKSEYWQRSGDFGRLPKNVSNLGKDVVAPYVHVVDSFMDDNATDPFESRSTLLFFRGRTVRKDEGIVRAKLAKVLVGHEDVHYENSFATGDNIKASSKGMRSSKFCLHPAGDTPSSCRLFDAIVSHCVPVIVSDRIELPYEDELDYEDFSIFFAVGEALRPNYMVNKLREIPKERWVDMWKRLKNISYHYEFQYPPKKDDAVNMLWRQVRHKIPAAKLATHRGRRLKIPDWWKRR
ncbi:probable arabinosyltransferase ARAD1 isoform X2 [Aristolochia californica]|uniref:probable arabinosyltransferase ARAD1 isoform X2 n=1 Tax=Aristolochia californica TaxID=171875 RepID=UPI0035D6CFF5